MNMDERRVTYKRRGTRRADKNIADKLIRASGRCAASGGATSSPSSRYGKRRTKERSE